MMAFAARGLSGTRSLNDPKYVRWYATFITMKDGNYSENNYPLHQCTEDDMKKFFTPDDDKTEKSLNDMYKAGDLFCFDWHDYEFFLQGNWESGLDY